MGISEGFLILNWMGKCCSVSLLLPPKLSRNWESLSDVRQELCRPKAPTFESPVELGHHEVMLVRISTASKPYPFPAAND